jgi:hypothetical protein
MYGFMICEEINNAEIFRDDYITFRRDRCSRGGGVFICVRNNIDCRELWTDEDFEMIGFEISYCAMPNVCLTAIRIMLLRQAYWISDCGLS